MLKYKLFAGAMILLLVMVLVGCGPSEEERKAMQTFNDLDELIAHGGYVKKFERFESRPDKVFVIEAEIVDADDVPLGLLRSERVEGFGTARPRIQWYKTPGVREEWTPPRRGNRRGPRGADGPPRREGHRRRRDGAAPREGES